jgi:AraC family transcriptional regulator
MSSTSRALVARCLDRVYECIDAPLSLAQLAAELEVSESALQRAFIELIGVPPATLFRRLRLELAFRTLRSRGSSVLETALASGFQDHSAFSRSFRRAFGFAPAAAREVVHIQGALESIALEEPDLVELAPLQLQAAVTRGLYFVCASQAWQQLTAALARVSPGVREQALFVGQALDDPHAPDGPAEDAVRFSAGVVGIDADLGLERSSTRPGMYARFRYTGKLSNIGLAYHHIYGAYRERARDNGYALASAPALCMLDGLPSAADDMRVLIAVPIDPIRD